MKLAYSNKGCVLRSSHHLAVNLWNQLDIEFQSIDSEFESKSLLLLRDMNQLTDNRDIIG